VVIVIEDGPPPPLRGGSRLRATQRLRFAFGWTLIELLLVLAIVGTLSSLAIIKIQDAINLARVAKAIGDIETIQAELTGFESDDDTLPSTLAGIDRDGYLDPWGRPYQYFKFPPGTRGRGGTIGQARKDRFLVPLNSTFDLYSMGKDGESQPPLNARVSHDDIIRANDGGFVGLAARF
jgi:general secretion pathway protein G